MMRMSDQNRKRASTIQRNQEHGFGISQLFIPFRNMMRDQSIRGLPKAMINHNNTRGLRVFFDEELLKRTDFQLADRFKTFLEHSVEKALTRPGTKIKPTIWSDFKKHADKKDPTDDLLFNKVSNWIQDDENHCDVVVVELGEDGISAGTGLTTFLQTHCSMIYVVPAKNNFCEWLEFKPSSDNSGVLKIRARCRGANECERNLRWCTKNTTDKEKNDFVALHQYNDADYLKYSQFTAIMELALQKEGSDIRYFPLFTLSTALNMLKAHCSMGRMQLQKQRDLWDGRGGITGTQGTMTS